MFNVVCGICSRSIWNRGRQGRNHRNMKENDIPDLADTLRMESDFGIHGENLNPK